MLNRPRLRPLDFRPVNHKGKQMWLLHDPLQLSPLQLVLPPALAQILPFCDGTRTVDQIHEAFADYLGVPVAYEIVSDTLAQIDDACLFENPRSIAAQRRHLEAYLSQPHRPPALAGVGYPDGPAALRRALIGYGAGDTVEATGFEEWRGRGIVSPHIDYPRGGSVYAKTWRRAEAAVRDADLVLIFGTDHAGSQAITLTQQRYATPFGVLPTDLDLVQALADAVRPADAFDGELHHRQEHSIELSAVWLHHTLGAQSAPPVVPILVGSFHHFLETGTHPRDDPGLTRFLATLSAATQGRRVLAVASVDLAHVGPAFGDSFAMDQERRQALQARDRSRIESITLGDADRFFAENADLGDGDRVCGFAPVYLLLRYLGETNGHAIDYAQCTADAQNQSLVSICGALLA